jgi:four helix bundle protein
MQGNGKVWDVVDRSFAFSVAIVKLFDAGTSVGSNVREGQAAQSRAYFITKYTIALKEANETDYWLSLVIAAELLLQSQVSSMLDEARELSKILGRCVVTARRNDPKPKRVR